VTQGSTGPRHAFVIVTPDEARNAQVGRHEIAKRHHATSHDPKALGPSPWSFPVRVPPPCTAGAPPQSSHSPTAAARRAHLRRPGACRGTPGNQVLACDRYMQSAAAHGRPARFLGAAPPYPSLADPPPPLPSTSVDSSAGCAILITGSRSAEKRRCTSTAS
jgi:hypothetical protein